MFVFAIALVAALDALPKVWILDVSSLPDNSPIDYTLTLRVQFADGHFGSLSHMAYKGSDAADLRAALFLVLRNQRGWKVTESGLRIYIQETGRTPLRRVSFVGDGPKPLVRWELAPPKK